MVREAGESRGRAAASWVVLAALGVAALHPGAGCQPVDRVDDAAASPLLREVLRAIGPEVVLPTLGRFGARVAELRQAAEAWAASGAPGDRELAQGAFLDAMATWQEAELHQIGPAASSLAAVGGADLRDEIYSWPTVNPCRVDQETVSQGYLQPDYFSANLINSYGLDAVEHVLFADAGNACPGQVDINAEGSWDALGPDEVAARRAAFTVVLAGGVLSVTDELLAAWAPAGGDFSGALDDGSVYDSHQEALNAVTDALFYLESFTQEAKLARPLGLYDCEGDGCAEQVEGLASGGSVDWIAGNLRGFRALFTGGEGPGLDDYLVELGHGDLADAMLAALDQADLAASAIEGPLDVAIREQRPQVVALLDAVEAVGDLVKGDLTTVLSVRVPAEAAGDND